jgi:L-lactate utilization protein LutB
VSETPTKEEWLRWLTAVEYLTERYAKNSEEDKRRFQMIHNLIESQPRVTRKELQKIALACSWASDETTLEKWLESKGVIVVEKE